MDFFFWSERLVFSHNYLIFSDLLQTLVTLDSHKTIKLMPHFYARLISSILIVTWLIQQTKKNNHQVSKKQGMVLQAHCMSAFANLARATEAQQRWLIQLNQGFSSLSFDITVLFFAKKRIGSDEVKFSFWFQRVQAGLFVVKLGKIESSCWQ